MSHQRRTSSHEHEIIAHVKVFRAQMLISGVMDGVRCKMFARMLIRVVLDWFSNLAKETITSFYVFSRLYIAHFATNNIKPPRIGYFFYVWQQKSESLKKYLGLQ